MGVLQSTCCCKRKSQKLNDSQRFGPEHSTSIEHLSRLKFQVNESQQTPSSDPKADSDDEQDDARPRYDVKTVTLPVNISLTPPNQKASTYQGQINMSLNHQQQQTSPSQKQKHLQQLQQHSGLLMEIFKNVPKNLQSNRFYITVTNNGHVSCNLCGCEMATNDLLTHFQGRKHLGYLPRVYLESQAKWGHQRRSQLSLNEILGGKCMVCNVKIPGNRMFIEHCKGRKHQTRLSN